jgi:hypothetical protein
MPPCNPASDQYEYPSSPEAERDRSSDDELAQKHQVFLICPGQKCISALYKERFLPLKLKAEERKPTTGNISKIVDLSMR